MAFCLPFPKERATASVELPEATAKITTYMKKTPKLSKKRWESSRIITGYRKLLLTFALEAKGAVSLDSIFPTTLLLPQLFALSNTHTRIPRS